MGLRYRYVRRKSSTWRMRLWPSKEAEGLLRFVVGYTIAYDSTSSLSY
jgi:hypothetical protein